MTRSRKNSIVQNIASQVGTLNDSAINTDDLYELLKNVKGKEKQGFDFNTNKSCEDVDKYTCYLEYTEKLSQNTKNYSKLDIKIEEITKDLKDLIKKFNDVSTATTTFQHSTNPVSKELDDSQTTYDTLQRELKYYQNLDIIARKLSQYSTPNVVVRDSFKSNLIKIDESIRFLEDHPDYMESNSYRIRFKQCLVRSCSLITNYLNQRIKYSENEVSKKLLEQTQKIAATKEVFLYNKFAASSSVYKELILNLVQRSHIKEVNSLLIDCLSTYFQVRLRLLKDSTSQQLDESPSKQDSLAKYIQDNIIYFEALAHKEYTLFFQFYPMDDELKKKFNSWCFELFEPLYDNVRMKVLRENSILTLCDSITLLNKFYQMEEGSPGYKMQFKDIQLNILFKPLLKECQSRLIFRSQIYIEEHINKFKPKIDSFVIGHRKQAKIVDLKNGSMSELAASLAETTEFSNCYLPLLNGIALLSKIYQMVNSTVFDDLAHTIVHECILSIRKAFQLVSSNSKINNLDNNLSLLRNLLLLRDQIQTFDIQYISKETYLDFSGVLESIRGIGKYSSSVLNLGLSTVPRVINNMVDARSELVDELRQTITGITKLAADDIIQESLSLKTRANLLTNNTILRESIETKLPTIYEQLGNFIINEEVKSHLMDAIQQELVSRYTAYYKSLSEAENISHEKLSEIMYIDVFQNFVNNEVAKLVGK